jgi:hypothetical protein
MRATMAATKAIVPRTDKKSAMSTYCATGREHAVNGATKSVKRM